ncbi:MAG: GNAT family N-acetyltransferase [Myxococcales bacterium]|nr:GNAT family N-acetyltransferase [Myxococcales bacterium]MCB9642572.1 GNAT family N-acetyltransferase [Myxococcales bacterium]
MAARELTNREEIEPYLRKNVGLHMYALGDLEEPYWSRTRWWGWEERGELRSVLLLYHGDEGPCLLGLTDELSPMQRLLAEVEGDLPSPCYAHLSPRVAQALLRKGWSAEKKADLFKMVLTAPEFLEVVRDDGVLTPTDKDYDALEALYKVSYPGHWFTRSRLSEGWVRGIKEGNRWVAVAGVHVVSRQMKVAALGNITVHPEARGAGLGMRITGSLCRALHEVGIKDIGLNVRIDNKVARSCYERLGFSVVASYGEFVLQRGEEAS